MKGLTRSIAFERGDGYWRRLERAPHRAWATPLQALLLAERAAAPARSTSNGSSARLAAFFTGWHARPPSAPTPPFRCWTRSWRPCARLTLEVG